VYRAALLTAVLVAGAALAAFALLGGDDSPEFADVPLDSDPFAYEPARESAFEARAAAGHSHVIYAKSPDGAAATARRVERYRPRIEEVAESTGVDADVLEAMVFLESAGRPEVAASDDLEGAVGLTQILAQTGTDLLGMRVDVEASERLTRKIRRAERRGKIAEAGRLKARRRQADERFDPEKSLEATGRYLELALARFGREDLAVVSYHMGMGNLENVLAAYGEDDPSYAQLFFDATPDRHPRTYRLLTSLGDDSKTYLWRVYASREAMRLYREDPAELGRLSRLQAAKASAEEVLHPRSRTEVFEHPDDLDDAYADGELRPFPDDAATLGLRPARGMGELAGRLDADRALYRGLRPEAYALAVYLAAGVREIAGTRAPLVVTSTVRDLDYQRLLARRNPFATRAYSLHTTGFAFDVRRSYASRGQAAAFQYMLDRLQALNLIAWVREPGTIHITVSGEARRLVDHS
jgi:soluble lytic murein transglycosylase-like protein